MTDLINAAIDNDIATVKKLIDNGADVDQTDNEGDTALMVAAREGCTEITQLLIDNGANVNHADSDGETPLISAARWECTECAKLLIDNGANVNHADSDGHTALMWAARWGKTEIVQLLIASGANIDHTNNKGYTPIMMATRNGHTEITQLLKERTHLNQKEKSNVSKTIFDNIYQGLHVIVRSHGSGVHFGIVKHYDAATRTILMQDTRRLFKWYGFTLSYIANNGMSNDKALISQPVPEMLITEVAEITPCSDTAIKNLSEYQTHEGTA